MGFTAQKRRRAKAAAQPAPPPNPHAPKPAPPLDANVLAEELRLAKLEIARLRAELDSLHGKGSRPQPTTLEQGEPLPRSAPVKKAAKKPPKKSAAKPSPKTRV